MTQPQPIPAENFTTVDLISELQGRPEALAVFVLNVGDGDAQVVLLPTDPVDGHRRVVVVDAATAKPLALIEVLTAEGLLPGGDTEDVALVVATHPHQDHIGGMARVLAGLGDRVAEFWDPGYFHPIGAFHQMMAEVEQRTGLLYSQPTSGLSRWIGRTAVTVLSPSIHLRNRFDTYGVEINDSSISLRLQHPAARVVTRDVEGNVVDTQDRPVSVVLGGDAQTLSWSYVLTDFPFLMKSNSASSEAIAAATGDVDLLRAHVFKVSHHASKRGINLELIERIAPRLTVISCAANSARYHFPHDLAQEIIREARDPHAGSGTPRDKFDWELNMHYTCDCERPADGTGEDVPLGSVVTVLEEGRNPQVWRLRDNPQQDPSAADLRQARRMRR
jgi:beta-lactamase superfamily II metal-dependent hydrolase